jgi:GNAT superfamily N-acetyltransferase
MSRTDHPGHLDVTIRIAVPDDLTALREVYRRASLANEGDRDTLLAAPDALTWDGLALEARHTRVVVDADDRVLGFATVVPCGAGLELDDLFVDPEHMRRGIATRLVSGIAADAADLGVPWIEVTANPHAAAFYESAGFEPVGSMQTGFGDAPRLRRTIVPQA